MSGPIGDAGDLFDLVAVDYLDRPGVALGRVWHNEGLTLDGKIFAMVVRGRLVVKLAADRVGALIGVAQGVAFEPRPGRPMKEWVMIAPPGSTAHGDVDLRGWRDLVGEAQAFAIQLRDLPPKRVRTAG